MTRKPSFASKPSSKPAKPAKAKKPKHDRNLDPVVGYLRDHGGSAHAAIVFREVFEQEHPTPAQIDALVASLKADERFGVKVDGIKSIVSLAEMVGKEPEEVKLDSPVIGHAVTNSTPSADGKTHTVEVAAPTIGELHEQAKKEEAEKKAARPAAVAPVSHNEEQLAAIQQACSLRDICRVKVEQLKKRLSSAKAEEKQADIYLEEIIGGQASILKPQQATGQAIEDKLYEEAPKKEPKARKGKETPKATVDASPFDARGQGARAAIEGATELGCPYDSNHPSKRAQWLDGWREQMRIDSSEREAIVQGLTREKLVAALIPNNGLLPAGEAAPSIATVKYDERPHMVIDMLSADEGPVKGVERWSLQPVFTRDEWGQSFGDAFGNPIAGVDANDEAKSKRIAGGIDAGRIVKVGRSKMVVGPRQQLTVATVVVKQMAAKA